MTGSLSPHARFQQAPSSSDLAHQRLIQRIRRAFAIEWKTTTIVGKRLPWIHVVDPDRLLEEALERTDRTPEELDPFWAATWPAAVGLEQYLHSLPLKEQRVLELGCGSGRVGIAAALMGAKVTMTDGAAHALLVARCNAWPFRDRVTIRRLNWRTDQLSATPFRWIVGSDLVYDPSLWGLVEACARRHLAADGRLILSEPQRHTGDGFLEFIVGKGWQVSIQFIPVGSHCSDIRIFDLRLP